MYLTDNACHSSVALVGKCRVFATDGGCRICNDGYYIHEKTCLACDGRCAKCLNGESCKICSATHFMTVDGECKDENETVGCAGDVSSEYGCSAYLPGYFLSAWGCVSCGETFDGCAECTATTCSGCDKNYVMHDGGCVPLRTITDGTAANNSWCTKCAFWLAPTESGDAYTTYPVWLVVLLAVLDGFILLAAIVAGVFIASTISLLQSMGKTLLERSESL